MIEVHLNGEKKRFPENSSIKAVLDSIKIKPAASVVEYNGEILRRDVYTNTFLKTGDRMEVIRMVCGG